MTDSLRARYDGLATWYEQYNAKAAEENRDALIRLLGSGEGWCLDVGCGTGHYFDAVRSTGRSAVTCRSASSRVCRASAMASIACASSAASSCDLPPMAALTRVERSPSTHLARGRGGPAQVLRHARADQDPGSRAGHQHPVQRGVIDRGSVEFAAGDRLSSGDIVLMHFKESFREDLERFVAEARRSGLRPALLEHYLT